MTLSVDRDVPIPADAKAVIVAQNLVAARYVQLTPAYRNDGGPKMADGAVIPLRPHRDSRRVGRGQDPVDAPGHRPGPAGQACRAPRSREFIDSAANALGRQRRQAAADARSAVRGGADASPRAAATSSTSSRTCRPSSRRCGTASTRSSCSRTGLATLTSVINDSRSDLDGAIANLSVAIGEVQRFVAGTREPDRRADSAAGQRHPDPGRQQDWRWRTSCTSRRTRSPTATTSTTRHRRLRSAVRSRLPTSPTRSGSSAA